MGHWSSHLGDVIRGDDFHDHLDELNQLPGLASIFDSNPKWVFPGTTR